MYFWSLLLVGWAVSTNMVNDGIYNYLNRQLILRPCLRMHLDLQYISIAEILKIIVIIIHMIDP